ACEGTDVAPSVRITYAAGEHARPRPTAASVEVYHRGQATSRAFDVIGKVGVLSHSSHTFDNVLTDYAQRAARQMGGDAIVDLHVDDAASVRPKAGEQGMLSLSASVVRWQ